MYWIMYDETDVLICDDLDSVNANEENGMKIFASTSDAVKADQLANECEFWPHA